MGRGPLTVTLPGWNHRQRPGVSVRQGKRNLSSFPAPVAGDLYNMRPIRLGRNAFSPLRSVEFGGAIGTQ